MLPDGAAMRRALSEVSDAASGGAAEDAYARAVWSTLIEPGDRIAGALIETAGPVRALEIAVATGSVRGAELGEITPTELRAARDRWAPRRGRAEEAIALARRSGVRLVTPEDARWPARTADLGPFAPVCLWVRGDTRLLDAGIPAIALVGARAASSYGEFLAAEFAAEGGQAGITVYSGGAYGIDGAAHRGALSADGGTVAVMAGGVERPYPAGHRELIDRIAQVGLVIAEVPCGTAPTKHRFLARNRLIAACSDATVVVEAGWRSGALNTAHHAQALGRPLGVIPGPVTSASSMGCHRLLREGEAICVTCFADVREMLGDPPACGDRGRPPAGGDRGMTDDATRIRDALSTRSARTVEDIARRAGFGVHEAAGLLGMLELTGLAARRGAGWVHVSGAGPVTLW
ncbi:DNA-processing protein DprA [Microbacterium flavum]|nr:DNA-processing protein DprA [Microbacterium flavum]